MGSKPRLATRLTSWLVAPGEGQELGEHLGHRHDRQDHRRDRDRGHQRVPDHAQAEIAIDCRRQQCAQNAGRRRFGGGGDAQHDEAHDGKNDDREGQALDQRPKRFAGGDVFAFTIDIGGRQARVDRNSDVDVDEKNAADDQPWNDAGDQELGDRDIGKRSDDDREQAWRDDRGEAGAADDQAGGDVAIIAARLHARNDRPPQHCGNRHGDTRECSEDGG